MKGRFSAILCKKNQKVLPFLWVFFGGKDTKMFFINNKNK